MQPQFVSKSVFEMDKIFKTKLALRPVGRLQRRWTFLLVKNLPQIECAHWKTLNIHPGAVATLSIFFSTDRTGIQGNEKWVQITTANYSKFFSNIVSYWEADAGTQNIWQAFYLAYTWNEGLTGDLFLDSSRISLWVSFWQNVHFLQLWEPCTWKEGLSGRQELPLKRCQKDRVRAT